MFLPLIVFFPPSYWYYIDPFNSCVHSYVGCGNGLFQSLNLFTKLELFLRKSQPFFQSIWYDQLDLTPLLYQALDLINLCWKCHANRTDRTCLECCWGVILEKLINFAGTELNQCHDWSPYSLPSLNLIGSMKILKVFFFVHWGTKTRSFWRKCFKVPPPPITILWVSDKPNFLIWSRWLVFETVRRIFSWLSSFSEWTF